MAAFQYFDITVSNDTLEDDIYPILQALRPHWTREALRAEKFSKGFINSMTCFYQEGGPEPRDGLVVRVYGLSMKDFNPREKELLSLQVAQAVGCFPPLHATFNNGVVYQYAVGRLVTFKDLLLPDVIQELVRKLHAFHVADIDSISLVDRKGQPASYDKTPEKFDDFKDLIHAIPDEPKSSEKARNFTKLRQEFTDELLQREHAYMAGVLEEVQLPTGLSHGDLHPRNIVIDDDTGKITFIDYEITGFKLKYADLAMFFRMKSFHDLLGMSNPDDPDITEDVRRMYLRTYLTEEFVRAGKSEADITDADMELIDVAHEITVAAMHCGVLLISFAFVDMPMDLDLLALVPAVWEEYCRLKADMPRLKERYLQLKRAAEGAQ